MELVRGGLLQFAQVKVRTDALAIRRIHDYMQRRGTDFGGVKFGLDHDSTRTVLPSERRFRHSSGRERLSLFKLNGKISLRALRDGQSGIIVEIENHGDLHDEGKRLRSQVGFHLDLGIARSVLEAAQDNLCVGSQNTNFCDGIPPRVRLREQVSVRRKKFRSVVISSFSEEVGIADLGRRQGILISRKRWRGQHASRQNGYGCRATQSHGNLPGLLSLDAARARNAICRSQKTITLPDRLLSARRPDESGKAPMPSPRLPGSRATASSRRRSLSIAAHKENTAESAAGIPSRARESALSSQARSRETAQGWRRPASIAMCAKDPNLRPCAAGKIQTAAR